MTNNISLNFIKRFVFGGVGLLMSSGAFVSGWFNWQFINRVDVARGEVLRLNAGGSHPEITFTTSTGDVIEYPQGEMIFGYQTGDTDISLLRCSKSS